MELEESSSHISVTSKPNHKVEFGVLEETSTERRKLKLCDQEHSVERAGMFCNGTG